MPSTTLCRQLSFSAHLAPCLNLISIIYFGYGAPLSGSTIPSRKPGGPRGPFIRTAPASDKNCAVRAAGKRWGGSKKGRRVRVTDDQVRAIVTMKAQGEKVSAIARAVGLSRLTIYRVLDCTY